MISQLNNWETNLFYENGVITTLVSKDEETGEYFRVFVGFNKEDDKIWYSYSFLLTDKDNKPKTNGFLTKREEINKHLPNDIKNKKLIFPIIEAMTRKLLDKQLPNEINRQTSEQLDGDSLKRYEIITNIMVNEYGYKLIEKKKDEFGYTHWKLSRLENMDKNKDMKETYNITHRYTDEERAQRAFGWILAKLPKINNGK